MAMLDPSRMKRAEDVFRDMVDLPAARREAALNEACDGDEELRRFVLRLLRNDDSGMGSFLDTPPSLLCKTAPESRLGPREAAGQFIDRYKLLQEIGEGGFGTVWMAEQREPVHRQVALKIIKQGMDTRQVIARFEAERQALAMMDHPNIARVFDAGATDSGRPFFVMELVKGQPITTYCDQHNQTIRERLTLFDLVCRAVQHAHQKGVIHRDIKPSNVMVTLHDGVPVPKVIDFGIAKATSQPLTDKTLFTHYGQFIGTPQYMAPEQAELSGLDIDTRADVYSLGVLLYELVTGTTPLDVRSLRSAGYPEMQRLIRDSEAPRPSTRLSSLDTLADVAAHRGVDPRRLSLMVRGDLDWIVLKALEKDRSRRYETASAFGDDIRRFLRDEPVLATPPGAVYRLRKFVRRNRVVVAAGATVFVSLVAGIAATAWYASAADMARAQADRRSAELEQVAGFQAARLADIDVEQMGAAMRAALLDEAKSAMTRARLNAAEVQERAAEMEALLEGANFTSLALRTLDDAIFERALAAVHREFPEQPQVRARMLHTLADTLGNLGLFERAVEAQRQALDLLRGTLGDDDRQTLGALNNLGHQLHALGRREEAETCIRQAVAGYRRILGSEHEETLSAVSNLGSLLKDMGNVAEAEPLYREALEGRERLLGPDHPSTLTSYNNMGTFLAARGQREAAETFHRRALEGRRRVLGDDHRLTIVSVMNLGISLVSRGRHADAQPLLEEALASARRTLGDDHPETLAALFYLGVLFRESGRLADAEPLLRESMEGRRRTLGSDHSKTMQSTGMLAALLRDQGRPALAEPLFRDLLERSRRVLGDDHPGTIAWVNNLGQTLLDRENPAEAETLFRTALESRRRVLGSDHPDTLPSLGNVASALAAQGRLADAEVLYREAVERSRNVLGADHPNTLGVVHNLGRLLRRMGMLDEAEALTADAARRARVKLPPGHWRIPVFLMEHAQVLTAKRQFAEAERELLEACDLLMAAVGAQHAHTTACVEAIASMYDDWHAVEPGEGHDARAAAWRERRSPSGAAGDDAHTVDRSHRVAP